MQPSSARHGPRERDIMLENSTSCMQVAGKMWLRSPFRIQKQSSRSRSPITDTCTPRSLFSPGGTIKTRKVLFRPGQVTMLSQTPHRRSSAVTVGEYHERCDAGGVSLHGLTGVHCQGSHKTDHGMEPGRCGQGLVARHAAGYDHLHIMRHRFGSSPVREIMTLERYPKLHRIRVATSSYVEAYD
jgi:hypothetical protein